MELPHLGESCSAPSCRQHNDYLLLKCTYCLGKFCQEHSKPSLQASEGHFCANLPQDARALVCPKCNVVVACPKGTDPNVAVDAHIRGGCIPSPAKKVYENTCTYKSCTKHEILKITCAECGGTYCIKHRFERDHECKGKPAPPMKFGFNNSNQKINNSKKQKKDGCIIS